MPDINSVLLIGHLGEQPLHRVLTGNISVVSFPLATTEFFLKKGVREEHTEWHNIVMWRQLADQALHKLSKGLLVCIEGKLRSRTYSDTAGHQRHMTEIIASGFKVLGMT